MTPDFESKPIVPVQPDREVYGLNDMMLFRCWNHVDWKQMFGEEPAPFDSTRRAKLWFDSTVDMSDPEAQVPYRVVRVVKGQPVKTTIWMPAWEAASLNLPGKNDSSSREPWEIPIREPLPNESFVMTPFGVQVIRTDKRLKTEMESGKFMPEDRAVLQAIAKKVGV